MQHFVVSAICATMMLLVVKKLWNKQIPIKTFPVHALLSLVQDRSRWKRIYSFLVACCFVQTKKIFKFDTISKLFHDKPHSPHYSRIKELKAARSKAAQGRNYKYTLSHFWVLLLPRTTDVYLRRRIVSISQRRFSADYCLFICPPHEMVTFYGSMNGQNQSQFTIGDKLLWNT